MRFDQRVVSQTPLHTLWNDGGVVSEKEFRQLDAAEIAALLRRGKVRFVVANLGSSLKWVPVDECYDFWKSEVKSHLAEPTEDIFLEDFLDEYCYSASEWDANGGEPIVLLLMSH